MLLFPSDPALFSLLGSSPLSLECRAPQFETSIFSIFLSSYVSLNTIFEMFSCLLPQVATVEQFFCIGQLLLPFNHYGAVFLRIGQ